MKKINYRPLLLAGMLVAGLSLEGTLQAQSKDKKGTTVRVRVSENHNGRTEVVEKSYELGSLSEPERKEFVDKVLDSLNTGTASNSGNRRVTVTVDEGDGNVTTRERRRVEVQERAGAQEEPRVFRWRGNDDDFHVEFDSREMRDRMRRVEEEVRPRLRGMVRDLEQAGERMGTIWTGEQGKPASVRALNVYPNNPDNGTLNLRFMVPEAGDVTVTVTDTRGKEVARKEIKNFSGDYMGQIELKKNTKGTLFVTVIQKEDGAVRRVVIP
jgi:hypothetical protein